MTSYKKADSEYLRAEQEVHNVAVFDHVVLAFDAHLAGVFGPLLAPEGDEIEALHNLSDNIT